MKTLFLTTALAIGIASGGIVHAQNDQSKERRDARKEQREERRDARKDRREERRDDRKDRRDKRQDRAEERQDKRQDRAEKRQDRAEKRQDRAEKRQDKRQDRRDARKDRREYRDQFRRLRTRMAVSSYGPHHGPSGTKVTIRGQHFPPDAKVMYSGKPITAKVTPTRIVFKIPRGPGDGQIVIMGQEGPMVVGVFDPRGKVNKAERKKRRAEREQRARERMQERWKSRAKDRAERRKNYDKRQRERAEDRAERARKRAATIRTRWKRAFLASPEVQAELALHAERKARLIQMRSLADIDDREKLTLRIEILLEKEDARHERRMKLLETNFKG